MEREGSWRAALDAADWTAQVGDYAIIRLDPDGLVLSWNAGAERIKGYAQGEVVGRSFEVFYAPEDREAGLPRRLLRAARERGSVEHLGWRVRQDGSHFWGDVVLTAVRGEDGGLLGYVKITRDLTEQHRLEQARELFLAGIGHDLRGPLTSMEGYAALLRDELVDQPALADFAVRIGSNALRLMKLVDLIVEHARLRVGGVGVRLEPVDLGSLLSGVVEDMIGALGEHEVVVAPTDATVLGDPTALSRVFGNVLGNAAKYSPPGTRIDVHVEVAPEGRVEVVVADRGRGIDPEDLAAIFNEFERGRRAQDDGGFGLGLAVVRHLVELQGGAVEIGTGRYGGTDVTVRLPVVEVGATGLRAEEDPTQEGMVSPGAGA